MAIILDGTNGISTPDLESAGPVSGTTASFSGDVTLGSSVLATPTGTAPSYLCRAWVNFNGTGTVAIRASGNVSSITDNGTGDYTVNFATAMADVNYQPTFGTGDPSLGGAWDYVAGIYQIATTYIRMRSYGAPGGSLADAPSTGVVIFR